MKPLAALLAVLLSGCLNPHYVRELQPTDSYERPGELGKVATCATRQLDSLYTKNSLLLDEVGGTAEISASGDPIIFTGPLHVIELTRLQPGTLRVILKTVNPALKDHIRQLMDGC